MIFFQGGAKQDSLGHRLQECRNTLDATAAKAKEIQEGIIADYATKVGFEFSIIYLHLWKLECVIFSADLIAKLPS